MAWPWAKEPRFCFSASFRKTCKSILSVSPSTGTMNESLFCRPKPYKKRPMGAMMTDIAMAGSLNSGSRMPLLRMVK